MQNGVYLFSAPRSELPRESRYPLKTLKTEATLESHREVHSDRSGDDEVNPITLGHLIGLCRQAEVWKEV